MTDINSNITESDIRNCGVSSLRGILKSLRAQSSNIKNNWGDRCCEICNEYIGDDWENDVAKHARPFDDRIRIVKKILNEKDPR